MESFSNGMCTGQGSSKKAKEVNCRDLTLSSVGASFIIYMRLLSLYLMTELKITRDELEAT